MEKVTVSEFRQHLARWLDRVQQGAEVIVTERGADIARVLPVISRRAVARERLMAVRGKLLLGEVDVPLASDDLGIAPPAAPQEEDGPGPRPPRRHGGRTERAKLAE
jgi:prevent-host-death family protein